MIFRIKKELKWEYHFEITQDLVNVFYCFTPFSQKYPSHHLKDKIGHIPKNGQKHKMPWTCFRGRMGVKNTLKIHQKHQFEPIGPC